MGKKIYFIYHKNIFIQGWICDITVAYIIQDIPRTDYQIDGNRICKQNHEAQMLITVQLPSFHCGNGNLPLR